MNKKPHVLILMSDEHRSDVAGFAGDKVVRTPVLDWLAETGVVFSNAYTPSPICVPARQCIMAGQYPKTCNCEGWRGLDYKYPTYATQFGRYGYRTVGFGKMHLQGYDQLVGWQSRPVGDVCYHNMENKAQDFYVAEDDDYDSFNYEGSKKWSDTKELLRAGVGRTRAEDVLSVKGASFWVDEHFNGTWYDRHDRNHPTLLYVGLHDPHYPYLCSEERFSYYINRVESFAVEEPFDHPFLGTSPWPNVPLQAGKDISQRTVRRARAAYYGMIEGMDAHFGQVLDSLKNAGEDLDDWIIVYLSDHGDQLGEHGIWEKQKFFEGSVKVPFIIRAPKYLPQGIVVTENISSIDLFPTLCELAGLEIPQGLDGRSLVNLAKGTNPSWPDEALSFFLQQGFENVMIKKGTLKYQWYYHESKKEMPEVLFDLNKDPHETKNLIDDSSCAEQVAEFRKQLREIGYGL